MTGVSVAGGLAIERPDVLTPAAADVATATPSPSADATTEAAGSTADATTLERRVARQVVSRSARRTDEAKATALADVRPARP